jgi:acyl-CoA reductase-like NAD-dependent aldehyde dehydrogenase
MTQPICEETELMFAPAKTYIRYEPLGVCAIFGAWNYPWTVCMKPLIQCITAGNCGLIKPSELAPHSSAVVKKFVEKYLDTSAFAVVEGGIDIA